MTDQVEPAAATAIVPLPPDPPPASSGPREYRKGNWSLHETLILITAKKMDDERRTRTGGRTAELRWKWVENFCWKNGCMRSQNQCNDKWDNLLRDYKKVRDYETCRLPEQSGDDHRPSSSSSCSYWNMERNERKEKNLPSNLTVEIFQALHEVVNRRNSPRITAALPVSSALPAEEQQHVPAVQVAVAATMLLPPPPRPPPPPPPSPPPPPLSGNEMSNSSESSTDDEEDQFDSDHNLGKRKMRSSSSSSSLSSSILQSASIISQSLLACEEKKEKRHRENLEMEERRLQVEEHRNEMSRQGLANLISAVNNLSNAINSIISDRK